jgi:hypothetical protein
MMLWKRFSSMGADRNRAAGQAGVTSDDDGDIAAGSRVPDGVLTVLAEVTVTSPADPLPMTRQAAEAPLSTLDMAGRVTGRRIGNALRPAALVATVRRLDVFAAGWDECGQAHAPP